MDAAIETKVKNIFSKLFGVPVQALSAETSKDSLAKWDSLQHMNLIMSIEDEFGVSLSEDDIGNMVSLGSVLSIVAGKLNGGI